MLYLLFRLRDDRYALDTASVLEILPVVHWKEIPQAAPGVLGAFSYHGRIVPLVDLSQFIAGQPARLLMSTRIVLIRCGAIAGGSDGGRLLGLLAEDATLTFQAGPSEFTEPGVEVEAAPYLGPVLTCEHGIVQLIDIQRLLPPEVKEQLFLTVESIEGDNGAGAETGCEREQCDR